MKTMRTFGNLAVVLALGMGLLTSGTASAVTLQAYVTTIYQAGTSAQVYLGHTVMARTNYNRLTAGGSYSAQCAASEMLPSTGQRTLSSDGINGPRTLNVTIPTTVPTRVTMQGFDAAAMRGRRLDCTYNWTARAVEGQYSIGVGGIGYVVGGGEMTEGGTALFGMNVPPLTDPNEGGSCIP